jgi:hypothetical protein
MLPVKFAMASAKRSQPVRDSRNSSSSRAMVSLKPDGAVSYRGAIYYSTASPKLARLNRIAVVFEYEVDANGNTHTKSWEWK